MLKLLSEWIAPGSLILFFGLCAILNLILFVRRVLLKRPNVPSLLPIVGGVLGVWGFYLAPVEFLSRHAWLPLLLDFGTIPWTSFVFWKVWRENRRFRS